MTTIINCSGFIVDRETRTVHCLGRMLPVTAVMYDPATPERPGSSRGETEIGRKALELVYHGDQERIAAALERVVPATSEMLSFNVICENGWWVEVTLWPENGEITFGTAPSGDNGLTVGTAEDVLELLAEVGNRPMFVPTAEDIAAYEDNPWCGLPPGTWLWDYE